MRTELLTLGPPMKAVLSMLIAVWLAGALDAAAQLRLPLPPHTEGFRLAANAADPAKPATEPAGAEKEAPAPTPQQLWPRNAGLILGGGLLVAAYGFDNWWSEGFTRDFRSEDENWFSQGTKYGGADKAGHVWFSYFFTRLLAQGFEAVGNEQTAAQRLGLWTTIGVMVGVEVLDGFSRQFRFSKEDAVMNVAGAGLGYFIERNPDLDRLADFRFLYKRSAGNDWAPAGDYSGQTYLLVAKATGVSALRQHSVLRYIELAIGYGTRGYEITPGAEGQRNLYYGVSLNLSEVLAQTAFRGAKERSRAQRASDMFLEFIQVPGTAALAKHQL